jgi:hypothetical protein
VHRICLPRCRGPETDALLSSPFPRIAAGVLLLCAMATATSATADVYVAPFAGVKFGGSTTLLDVDRQGDKPKWVIGATGTWLGRGIFGLEGEIAVLPGYFTGETSQPSRVTTVMGHIVIAAPRGWTRESLRPYISGGFGAIRVFNEDPFLPFERTIAGSSIGGGVIGFVTWRTGVKWDLRYVRGWGANVNDATTIGSARLAFWRATMGVVVKL